MLGDYIKTADFKAEKHVPVIEAPEIVEKGEWFEVEVSVGKEIPHPNLIEHHIVWIELYAMPEGAPYILRIGRYEFSPTLEEPVIKAKIKLEKNSKLIALSYCNIHGLWEGSKNVVVKE
ncbi:MAG TPA: class II SORL domain-containing protein [Fervidobacterium sp.]|nr:class II SORL domain-containing protein [Fervidobacterium sp.]HOM73486.1 class II SORL domain-containing protein [Fervidobacterium sp.]HOQ39010.1 class II SORL domain-containing protein [Fervidobacterium sp.]HPP17365.1 class II SORL domain-containing protein [Fervidobacterium sp.]HPT53452.1 class II SORL domain-containing protein [Fervidobacterium sp.]